MQEFSRNKYKMDRKMSLHKQAQSPTNADTATDKLQKH